MTLVCHNYTNLCSTNFTIYSYSLADWLYMKLKTTPRSDWVPHQRPYHRYKCREYTRVRQRKPSSRRDKDGWEYASTDDHDSKYSSTGEALHKTRRRRLTRRAIYRGKHVQRYASQKKDGSLLRMPIAIALSRERWHQRKKSPCRNTSPSKASFLLSRLTTS